MVKVFLSTAAVLLAASLVEGGGYPNLEIAKEYRANLKRKQTVMEYSQGLNGEYSASRLHREKARRPEPLNEINHRKGLPKSFDWCLNGEATCSPSWNQHIPVYCGSCYLHSSLSAAQDRITIRSKGRRAPVMLSRQTYLNCAMQLGFSNGCHGGEASEVFEYMKQHGLPEEGCQIYTAKDHNQTHGNMNHCSAEEKCHNCMSGKKPECWAIEKPIQWYAAGYGDVEKGAKAMMEEIYQHGPIVCGIASYEAFDYEYRGGIWTDGSNYTEELINHDVEIVGWGHEDGQDYWTIRNSWGTYWGEEGFFKIPRGTNHMAIESACNYVDVETKMADDIHNGKLTGSMYGIVEKKFLNHGI